MEGILLNNFKHTETHFEQLFKILPIGMAMIDFDTGSFLEVNESLLSATGYTREEFLNLNFWDITPKEYEKQEKQQIQDLIHQQKFGPNEKEYIKKDGTRYPIKISGFLITKSNGQKVVWGLIEDITIEKQHEIIYEDNKNLLEYIAIENSLTETFNKIIKLAEKRNTGSICSILLLDEKKEHLFTASAPSLPKFYSKAINGIKIGEKVGSCGSALYKKQRVVIDNIDTHENWQDYLELTNKANLHSCWSEPIISSKNEILGSFAIYTKEHKAPSKFEIKLIESYSNLASKAIEKDFNTKNIIEREKEVEQLFDNNQIGLMYLSSRRVITKVNQKLVEIFAYKNIEEMKGLNSSEVHLSKEYSDLFKEKYINTLNSGGKVDIEYQLKKKDGSIFWAEISGKTITYRDFSVGYIWMVKDISLRKEYELQLKNSELLNKNILSTIPDLIWLKDKDGSYLSCNPEFEKCYGIKQSDLIGKTDYDITNNEFANFFREEDKIAIKSKDTVINEKWVEYNTNHKKVLLEISKKAMRNQDGEIVGILGIGHDITERKQKEEELNELNIKAKELSNSQEAMLSLFDKGDAVLFKWRNDQNWNIEYVSLSVTKLFGYTQEEFLLGKIDYESCVHKNDLEYIQKELIESLNANLDYFKQEPYRIINKKGEEKWVLDNTVTIKNEKNEIISFISYIIDISEQIKNQELIFHQSKIASMGEMLGNISHQWRQPLSAISTLATGSRLKKEIAILDDNEFYENMDLINKNAQYLSKTIDDFRNFFTSDANIKKETNLKDTFNTIYSLIKDSFKISNIKIVYNLADTKLLINENIFIQAMINILNNARDALTQNNKEDKYVFVDLIQNEKEYILTIKDNAGGIPEKIKDKIFEPYFTTKHKSQGTGIGLYMTNQIITKQLQADILVTNVNYEYENKKFYGASFEIKIPI